MKIIILSLLFTSLSFAKFEPNREGIYTCVNYDESEAVESAIIYESRFGSGEPFYEVKVNLLIEGIESSFMKKVRLLSKYEDKVHDFSSGDIRIKIYRALLDKEGEHFWAFARMPKYSVHSRNWSCKDY